MSRGNSYTPPEPLWFRDAIIYELPVKSFYDSNNDGIGDFRGLTEKLDYLSGLGITAIWLLPFYPSPLRDDGYDIADYYRVHPDYGTLADFRRFMREAHRRDIQVITELVINHTSDQHPWFQRSRKSPPGSPYRDYYVWSDSPERYGEARIIFKDYESSNWSWDPLAGAYYWHRFYSHQPDLNYDNPQVRREMLRVLDFWFDLGVDGMRLDAIPYLYEREGTNCENLLETHAFLKSLRTRLDRKYSNRMFLAEANQWPEDAVAYFGEGDECHMCFHFPVMPRLYMALTMEDRFPIVDIMDQTPPIPEGCQWAMFLRNHDELTLEMVTDEERDYMYRVYAADPTARLNLGIRRRLAPLLGDDRRKIELLYMLLFSFPGTPILYYGDEIGMGDNYYLGDRDGVRTPMQWSSDRNAGFSRTNPQRLYLPVIIDAEYHFEALNVETQEKNQSSLLWWMKHLIGVRKHYRALSRGDLEFLLPDNPQILAFTRTLGEETILTVANLSHFHQVVELDLSRYAGLAPRELFSRNPFPAVREELYRLTLGPYGYLWLLLEREREEVRLASEREYPEMRVPGNWRRVLQGEARRQLETEAILPFLEHSRWFAGKARQLQEVRIVEELPLDRETASPVLLLLEAGYGSGPADWYQLPLAFAPGEQALEIMDKAPGGILAHLSVDGSYGVLYDGLYSEALRNLLLQMLRAKKKIKGSRGELVACEGEALKALKRSRKLELPSRVLRAEQSNSSVQYENSYFLKLYRRFEEGPNPDPEMVRYLSEAVGFKAVPAYAGSLEYRCKDSEPLVLAMLQEFVASQSDAWTLTLNILRQFFDSALTRAEDPPRVERGFRPLLTIRRDRLPEKVQRLVGSVYLEQTALLGQRTAEMHRALASPTADPLFAPEPFSRLYQRSLCQSLRSRALRGLDLLEKSRRRFPEQQREQALQVLNARQRILAIGRKVLNGKIGGQKIRIHGDYHLGQVLFTGKDFAIIDFEGEPMRSPGERRLKYSALRDVAGMLRSFHYAVFSALFEHLRIRTEDRETLEPYAELWYQYVSGVFLSAYRETAAEGGFLPQREEEIEILLQAFLLDKGIYEIIYELNNRPEWIVIPVRGILSILESAAD